MTFFSNLSSFGTVRAKPGVWVRKDPRENFVANVLKQIDHIDSGTTPADAGNLGWFKVEANGSYVITLRNGIRALRLGDSKQTQMVCKDKDAAIEYLGAAVQAAESGEFDALFEATKQTFKGNSRSKAPAQEPTKPASSTVEAIKARAAARAATAN